MTIIVAEAPIFIVYPVPQKMAFLPVTVLIAVTVRACPVAVYAPSVASASVSVPPVAVA